MTGNVGAGAPSDAAGSYK
ncbi:hypothetical protein AVEN_175784-1, partial [Araneus ventricosus]